MFPDTKINIECLALGSENIKKKLSFLMKARPLL